MRPSSENVSSLNGSPTLSRPALPSRGLELGRLEARDRAPRSPPGARACRAARPRAPRRRRSGPRPARTRTPTRSGRSPSACPSRGSRTRRAARRRPCRRGRSGRRRCRPSRGRRATDAWRTPASSAPARRSTSRSWAARCAGAAPRGRACPGRCGRLRCRARSFAVLRRGRDPPATGREPRSHRFRQSLHASSTGIHREGRRAARGLPAPARCGQPQSRRGRA